MSLLFGIFAAVLGAIIGSFLNVVVLRYNTGQSVEGRSACPVCGKPLHWYELIPVLSFVFLRGRCSECRTRISWQYPAVEFGTALLFFFSYQKSIGVSGLTGASIAMFAFYAVAWSLLIVMAAYDLRHKILPDGLTLAFAALALGGLVATRGWASVSAVTVADLARRFEDAGVAALLFTDVGRDGLLKGVNVDATAALAAATALPVIASGGVAGAADVTALRVYPNIVGVIVGRAIYDGRLTLPDALRLAGDSLAPAETAA